MNKTLQFWIHQHPDALSAGWSTKEGNIWKYSEKNTVEYGVRFIGHVEMYNKKSKIVVDIW